MNRKYILKSFFLTLKGISENSEHIKKLFIASSHCFSQIRKVTSRSLCQSSFVSPRFLIGALISRLLKLSQVNFLRWNSIVLPTISHKNSDLAVDTTDTDSLWTL